MAKSVSLSSSVQQGQSSVLYHNNKWEKLARAEMAEKEKFYRSIDKKAALRHFNEIRKPAKPLRKEFYHDHALYQSAGRAGRVAVWP